MEGAKDAACTWSLCSIRSGSTNCIDFPCPLESGPSSRFLGQPATGTRRVAGTTHTQSGRRWEPKVMVSGSITKDGMSNSKVDPCGVFSLRVEAYSVLCVQCAQWMHGRCARVKTGHQSFQGILHAENVKGIL